MSKKQKFIEGSIVRIELSINKVVYGRLLPGFKICIYDFLNKSDTNISIEEIIQKKTLVFVSIYKSVIVDGFFEIIGYKKLEVEEIDNIPPFFHQEIGDFTQCTLSWVDGTEKRVTPDECVGLERLVVWDAITLIQRIEDYYINKKNPYVELYKVILSPQ